MKLKLLLTGLLALFFVGSYAQKKKEVLSIIYVDNNNPSGDGINSSMLNDMISLLADTIKDNPFVFFLSDKKNAQVTENSSTASKLIDGMVAKNTAFPDQNLDVTMLRNKVFPHLKNFSGEINIYFYVTNKMIASLQDKYSPLFGLFPKELAHLYSKDVNKVNVRIIYPAISYSRVNETEVKNALNFNGAENTDQLVSYYLEKFQ